MLRIGKITRQTLLINANCQLLELRNQDLKLLTSSLWMLGKVVQIQVMAVAIVMTMRTMRIMVIGMGVKPQLNPGLLQ